MQNKKLKISILLGFVIALSAFGIYYVRYTWDKTLEEKSANALEIANIAGNALNGEMLKVLRATPNDLGTVAYESIKNRLMSIRRVDEKIRFSYLYVQRDNRLFFMADSEPATSNDYSPPGQEYAEADSQYFAPFIDGNTLITKPVTDRWGKWISVLVPLKNAETGNIIAVFGIDYPVALWETDAFRAALEAGFTVFLWILLSMFIVVVIEINSNTRKNEKNFRAIFETVDDVILVCDRTGKIQYCNTAAQKKLGYSAQELQKMLLSDLNPKQQHKEAEQYFNEIIAGKRSLQALPLERKDGSLLLVETKVFVGKWNGKDCVYKELTNEQELLQKFNQVFKNNPSLMLVATYPEYVLTDVNEAFTDKLGYTKEEVIGKEVAKIGFFVEDEKQEKISDIISKAGVVHDKEVKLLGKSRDLIEGVCSGEIIENQGKKYLLLVVTDQTSHIKAEKQLKKALSNAERLNKLMIGRELEMVELKKEIAKYKNTEGQK